MARASAILAGHSGAPALILASASRSRRRLLENAGLEVRCEAAAIDEDSIKQAMRAEAAKVDEVAAMLAELKAERVSRRHPEALVVGADQMLDCEGVWYEKARSNDEAAGHLRSLSGRTHSLVTAVCVASGGRRIWHHIESARLTMRSLGADFLEAYLEANGDLSLDSVGCYQLEGLGAQLFSKIDGDYFTILGLPLLPLLGFLRQHRVVAT